MKILIIAAMVTILVAPASAATLIVKKTGGAYSTLSSALAAASGGDTIRVDDSGTYNEAFAPTISITLAAGNGCSPRAGSSSGYGLVLNGLSTSETLTVTGMIVSSQGYAVLASSGCGNILATRCTFDSTSDEIIHLSRSSAATGSDVFDRCSVGGSSNALVGFYYATTASPLPNFKLLACLVTADSTGGGTGVKVTGSQTGPVGIMVSADVLGCTLYGVDTDERVTVIDCVFACNGTDAKFTYPGTPARVSYSAFANTLPASLGPGCIKITAADAMISPCSNPRLKTGSALFNVGTSGTSNGVTYDLDGTAYPQFNYWDMGCYESSTIYSMTMTPTFTSTPTETPTATETFTVTPTFTVTLTPDWPTPPPTPVDTATPWPTYSLPATITGIFEGDGAGITGVSATIPDMGATVKGAANFTMIATLIPTPVPTTWPTPPPTPVPTLAPCTPVPTPTTIPDMGETTKGLANQTLVMTFIPTPAPTATAIPVPTSSVPYVQTQVAAALTAVLTPVATATAIPVPTSSAPYVQTAVAAALTAVLTPEPTATPQTLPWIAVPKSSSETIQSDATVNVDAALQFSMAANTWYRIKMMIFFDTTATADFKCDMGFTGVAGFATFRSYRSGCVPGSVPFALAPDVTNPAEQAFLGTGTTGGFAMFDVTCQTGANSGTFSFRWAQNTSTAANTTVLAGSYLQYYSP